MDIKLKVKNCLKCTKVTDPNDSDELFCSDCGSPVINECTNYSCAHELPGDARYCKYCGSASLFLNAGLLEDAFAKSPKVVKYSFDDVPF